MVWPIGTKFGRMMHIGPPNHTGSLNFDVMWPATILNKKLSYRRGTAMRKGRKFMLFQELWELLRFQVAKVTLGSFKGIGNGAVR